MTSAPLFPISDASPHSKSVGEFCGGRWGRMGESTFL